MIGGALIIALAVGASGVVTGMTGVSHESTAPSAKSRTATPESPTKIAGRAIGREYKGKLDPIGPFNLRDLDGRLWTDRDFDGKVLIVVQWAAWCGPCISEFPQVQKLYETIRNDSSIRLTSIDLDEKPDEDPVRKFLKEFRKEYSFPVLFGWPRFKIKALPTTWIVDREGYIREVLRGSGPGWLERVQALVDAVKRQPSVHNLPLEVREAQRRQNELDGVNTR